jgi:tetratricopeptide (TPR) repeat protein
MKIFKVLKDQRHYAECLHFLSNVSREWGKLEIAEKYAQESVQQMLESGDRLKSADSLQNLGWNQFWEGRFRKGIISYQQSQAIYRELGVETDLLWVMHSQAWCELHLGNFKEARQLANFVGDKPEAIHNYTYSLNLLLVAICDIAENKYDISRKMVVEMLRTLEDPRDYDKGIASIITALAYIHENEVDLAIEQLEISLNIANSISAYYIYVHLLPVAALLFAMQGYTRQAVYFYEGAQKFAFVQNSVWLDYVCCNPIEKMTWNFSVFDRKQIRKQIANKDLEALSLEIKAPLADLKAST